jgi:hypothetical protein
MKARHFFSVAFVFFMCAPNSPRVNTLIGAWKNTSSMEATGIGSFDQVVIIDTIYDTTKIQFDDCSMKFIFKQRWKNNSDKNIDTNLLLNYRQLSDTLFVCSIIPLQMYYSFHLFNDSLFLKYISGDSLQLAAWDYLPFQGKFVKEN